MWWTKFRESPFSALSCLSKKRNWLITTITAGVIWFTLTHWLLKETSIHIHNHFRPKLGTIQTWNWLNKKKSYQTALVLGIIFGRRLFRIPVEAPYNLFEEFCGFRKSCQETTGILLELGKDDFLPDPFQLVYLSYLHFAQCNPATGTVTSISRKQQAAWHSGDALN